MSPRSGPTRWPRASPRPGPSSTSPTTTSSAPPSRATTRPSRQFLGRIYDNGYIYKDIYRGLYCVSLRGLLHRGRAASTGGSAPSTAAPVEHAEEENYFFRLSAFEDRLIEWYEANPGAVIPESKRNEALASSRAACATSPSPGPRSTGGCRCPWDDGHVFYVWYDALINYLTAIGYGEDDERFATWWPAVHHLIGKEIIRFHCVWWPAMCMAAGIDAAGPRAGPRLAPPRWREDVQLAASTRSSPGRAHRASTAWTRSATTCCGTPRSAPTASSRPRASPARYNADLANNLGNLLSRGWPRWSAPSAAGSGPAPDPTAAWPPRPAPSLAEAAAAWERASPTWPSRPPGASSGRPTPSSRRPSPGRPTPAPRSTPCWAAPSRSSASSRSCRRRPCPPTAEIWRRIGLEGSPADRTAPGAARLGRVPGGPPGGEGRTALPPAQGLTEARWTTP